MTTAIKDLDGLPAGEIKLLIAESERKLMGEVDERFNAHEAKLDAMQENMNVLVGTAKLTGLVQNVKATIDGLAVKHDAWHIEDLAYRSDITDRVTKIEADAGATAEQVANMKWIVMLNHYCIMWIVKTFDFVKDQPFFKILLSFAIIWLTAHYAPHLYEAIKPYLHLGGE